MKNSNEIYPTKLDPKKIGERIKKIRKEKGFTQVELAQKTGIAQNYISSYEIGRRKAQYDALANLALALNVSIDSLLGIEEVESDKSLESNLLKRMKNIQRLPSAQKSALIKTIDMYLKAANVTI
jgi:transcriptional regulator with XRE-family HTH domain